MVLVYINAGKTLQKFFKLVVRLFNIHLEWNSVSKNHETLKLILSFNHMVLNASKTKGGVGNEVGKCHNVIYRPPDALFTLIIES